MAGESDRHTTPTTILTPEQEEILDLYVLTVHGFYEELQTSDNIQVEIETQHLKRILTK